MTSRRCGTASAWSRGCGKRWRMQRKWCPTAPAASSSQVSPRGRGSCCPLAACSLAAYLECGCLPCWWQTPALIHPRPPNHAPLRPPAAAVFDGHGGFAAADYLQHNLYRIFTRVLSEQGAQADLESVENLAGLACPLTFTHVLTDSFKHADKDLLAWMHGEQLDARWYWAVPAVALVCKAAMPASCSPGVMCMCSLPVQQVLSLPWLPACLPACPTPRLLVACLPAACLPCHCSECGGRGEDQRLHSHHLPRAQGPGGCCRRCRRCCCW